MRMASYLVVSSFFLLYLVWMSAQKEAQQGKGSETLVGQEIATGYPAKQQRRENTGEMRDSPRRSHGEGGSAS